MRAMNGVSKNRHGVYYVRKKVPKQLEQATAEVLGNGKSRQVFLKRSLDTKGLREANIRAKPILVEFDMILALAEALTVQRPIRTTLEKREINQCACCVAGIAKRLINRPALFEKFTRANVVFGAALHYSEIIKRCRNSPYIINGAPQIQALI